MMKKKYMAPEATTFEFASEGVFAASLDYGGKNGEKVTNENQVLSNKGGWNSSLWSEME